MSPARTSLLYSFLIIQHSVLLGCVGPQVAVKRAFDFSRVRRVAVLGFSGSGGHAAADHLVLALLEEGADVVERRQLNALLRETQLGTTGLLAPASVQEVGQLLGVDAIFMGSVTSYAPARSYLVFAESLVLPALLGSGTLVSRGPAPGLPNSDVITSAASVGLSARMVDVETGSVLWSGHRAYEGIDTDGAMIQICRSFVRTLVPIWLQYLR